MSKTIGIIIGIVLYLLMAEIFIIGPDRYSKFKDERDVAYILTAFGLIILVVTWLAAL